MDQIDQAVAHLKENDQKNITEVAKLFSVDRSALSRRLNGHTKSATMKHENQMLLSQQQEHTLIQYINRLTEWGLPPTPSMLRNFVFDIVKIMPSRQWISRFRKRWSHTITSRYLKPTDSARKKVDNKVEYKAYFELIQAKLEQYSVDSCNIYNMDEKGFLIGFMNKAMRIFTKKALETGRVLGNMQDGNREWVTILACVSADGFAMPPGLIYQAKTGNIQDSWTQDLDAGQHQAHFASSPNGWTDNHLGLAWLTTIFDRYSKPRARNGRDWRVLFVDGHGSHLNMAFLDWALEHRVLVAVYPPHSTHRLQPLDVSLFSPLSTYYSQELDAFMHQSQGISTITKRDFFRLFWPAYKKAFCIKNIHSAWSKTGISPFNPDVVLSIFGQALGSSQAPDNSRPSSSTSSSSVLSASDWRKIKSLLKDVVSEVVTETDRAKAEKLSKTILTITTENALLKAQNDGFRHALDNEKKRRKRSKALFEELRAQDQQGATFFSPAKIQQAKDLQAKKELDKVNKKAEKEAEKVQQQIRALEKRREVEMRKQQRVKAAKNREVQKALVLRQKSLVKDGKQATKQLQETLQASVKKPRAQKPPEKRLLVVVLKVKSKVDIQAVLRDRRITRRPKYLSEYQLDP